MNRIIFAFALLSVFSIPAFSQDILLGKYGFRGVKKFELTTYQCRGSDWRYKKSETKIYNNVTAETEIYRLNPNGTYFARGSLGEKILIPTTTPSRCNLLSDSSKNEYRSLSYALAVASSAPVTCDLNGQPFVMSYSIKSLWQPHGRCATGAIKTVDRTTFTHGFELRDGQMIWMGYPVTFERL